MNYKVKTEAYFDLYPALGAVPISKAEGLLEEFSPVAPLLAAIIRVRRETGTAVARFCRTDTQAEKPGQGISA
nr:hypothetical protein [Agrobacterium sp. rho-8.1]